mmetsp:Transcript_70598/g.206651  ORF Transcript_70598/g.206651 Transcript_70598/m.206651 type:complete len:220 (+) Transcript_70598:77-736(+)
MPPPSGGRIVVAPEAPRNILAAFPAQEASVSAAAPAPTASTTASRAASATAARAAQRGGRGPRRPQPRHGGGAHGPRGGSLPAERCRSSRATLFSGERVCTNPKAKRSSAVVFRRPSSSNTAPHRRPIFVTGENGTDPRVCVDVHAPGRFSSCEQARYEGVRQGLRGGAAQKAGSGLPSHKQARAANPATPGASRASSVVGRAPPVKSQVNPTVRGAKQ